MTDYKLVPVEPTPEMLDAAVQDGICVDGKPVWKKDVVFQAKWKYQQMLAAAPAQQVDPVSAQVRYRRPEKGLPDWSAWQPAPIMLNRPYWEIDSRGWEVEYRLLYTTPQPAEQSTFTVGTDLSDGKLTVVVVKHENGTAWVIHSEVIQPAEQQPVGEMISNDGDIYWTDRHPPMGTKLYTASQPAQAVTQLVEALKAAQKEAVYGLNHARTNLQASSALGRVSAIVGAALATYRKGVQI